MRLHFRVAGPETSSARCSAFGGLRACEAAKRRHAATPTSVRDSNSSPGRDLLDDPLVLVGEDPVVRPGLEEDPLQPVLARSRAGPVRRNRLKFQRMQWFASTGTTQRTVKKSPRRPADEIDRRQQRDVAVFGCRTSSPRASSPDRSRRRAPWASSAGTTRAWAGSGRGRDSRPRGCRRWCDGRCPCRCRAAWRRCAWHA